jgi:hypothetical protein
MNTPDFMLGADIYEDKEKLEHRVAALWEKATHQYYQALISANKISDTRSLNSVLERHRGEVVRLVAGSLSKILKEFLTDEKIILSLIHEMQYNETIKIETEEL